MAKIDKSHYTKSQWRKIREQRKQEKSYRKNKVDLTSISEHKPDLGKKISQSKNAFVLGNGTSRKSIDVNKLKKLGVVYGCNALYRTHEPDYLVAVDVKMVSEICKSGYQHTHEVWTNPNRSFHKLHNLNYFHPSKGWSSGPTALWLASEHEYENIFVLGFDYKGIQDGQKFNNIYADSMNYKRSTDGATYFGNWLRQTKTVIQNNPEINYFRVIRHDNYCPEELNRFDNFKNITIDDFEKNLQFKVNSHPNGSF
jgi:hypothetical protein